MKNPLMRILLSAKVQVAVIAIVTAAITVFSMDKDNPARPDAIKNLVIGIFGLTGLIIAGWAYEDGKANGVTGGPNNVPPSDEK